MEIRICKDDIIPRAVDAGVLTLLGEYAEANRTSDQVVDYLRSAYPLNLIWDQIKELLADGKLAGISDASIIGLYGDNLPLGKVRPPAPSSIGTNGTAVWFTPPDPLVGTWRVYVNGALKTILTNYNNVTVAEIGAQSGDIVQICRVENNVVGWWGRVIV